MSITNSIRFTKYRMNMRKALSTASIEELKITLDETKREIERRNKQK